jgi:hypothetical protein
MVTVLPNGVVGVATYHPTRGFCAKEIKHRKSKLIVKNNFFILISVLKFLTDLTGGKLFPVRSLL